MQYLISALDKEYFISTKHNKDLKTHVSANFSSEQDLTTLENNRDIARSRNS